MGWVIKRIFLLFCLMLLLPVSAYASFKGLHPPMEIEPEFLTPDGMVFIKGGCFEMGDTFGDGYAKERPAHTVCVDDFYIGKYEVTVGEFRKFVDKTAYKTQAETGGYCYGVKDNNRNRYWNSLGFKQTDREPVVCVSWNDANEFIKWKGRITGKSYHLPTEAEWEYAARSGGKQEKFAGFSDESQLYLYANFCDRNCTSEWKTKSQNDGYKNTSTVGSYRPNGLGLYDMTGNVSEWVSDWYGEDYYKESHKDNPNGPSIGKYRVLRGGSWYMAPVVVRASTRTGTEPSFLFFDLGFRLALSPR